MPSTLLQYVTLILIVIILGLVIKVNYDGGVIRSLRSDNADLVDRIKGWKATTDKLSADIRDMNSTITNYKALADQREASAMVAIEAAKVVSKKLQVSANKTLQVKPASATDEILSVKTEAVRFTNEWQSVIKK